MIKYFKTSKEYFKFINKYKEKYNFDVIIKPKSVKVVCHPIT